MEVGVDLVRVHLPFGFVLRGVELVKELGTHVELRDLGPHRQDGIALLDVEPRMVLPLVRKANLGSEFVELLQRFLLCGLREPVI